ncbi:MAG TPA: hypothetical protein VMU80_00375 [Bryobacteraceae bacterium]|nr:hypothetical protein [Bryobacteraceae bacterium]
MKWAAVLLGCLNLAAAAELTGVRNVYILPMSHSLDQFIANRLTEMHVYQVVTDPARADTVITDQVGQALEDRLNDLYPPPENKEAKEAKEKQEKEAADKKPAVAGRLSILSETVNQADRQGSMSLSGRGHGTIFLVDVKTRGVLWSVFDRPKNTSPHELDHTAGRIVHRLKEDIKAQEKASTKDTQ